MIRPICSFILLLPVLLVCVGAAWNDREDATGDWGGARLRLEEDYGLHIDIDYTAEVFDHDSNSNKEPSFRGNLDLVLTIDTQKLGLWPRGMLLVYGQNGHGGGVSEELGLIMPVTNLEAEAFSQLSEFWLYQQIGGRLRFRLGKQDANRDFGNPRFPGNFINSSYGVLPGIPMPSFPTPGLGAVAFINVTKWLELRNGIYEGTPKIGSFSQTAFTSGAGIFGITTVVFRHDEQGNQTGQIGVWKHTHSDRSGVFALCDVLKSTSPQDQQHKRSMQFFIRGAWSPDVTDPMSNEIKHMLEAALLRTASWVKITPSG